MQGKTVWTVKKKDKVVRGIRDIRSTRTITYLEIVVSDMQKQPTSTDSIVER